MNIKLKFSAMLAAVVILFSGCATLSYESGQTTEKIDWREYLDC